MSRSFAALASAPLLALALVLTGCGADSGPDSAPDPADSPLSKYMMAVYGQSGDEEDWQKKAIEDNKKTEELVAQCMNEEGFEYIPQTNNMSFDTGEEWDPESEEWVAEYGYGAVNWPGRDDAGEEEAVEDPNQDYLTGLSESEQMAYSESLWGPQPAEEDLAEDGSYSPTWEEQGCYGWASHEIRGDDPMQLEQHKPLMDALQAFWQEQSTAPELSEVDAAWAECMADGGHGGFTKQADAQNSIQDEMNAVLRVADGVRRERPRARGDRREGDRSGARRSRVPREDRLPREGGGDPVRTRGEVHRRSQGGTRRPQGGRRTGSEVTPAAPGHDTPTGPTAADDAPTGPDDPSDVPAGQDDPSDATEFDDLLAEPARGHGSRRLDEPRLRVAPRVPGESDPVDRGIRRGPEPARRAADRSLRRVAGGCSRERPGTGGGADHGAGRAG